MCTVFIFTAVFRHTHCAFNKYSIKSSYYAGIMLNAFANLLCSKLCRHNWRKPTRDGFHLLPKSSVVASLIKKVLFKQLLIRTAE